MSVRELIEHRQVIVCCGAGGVGKTTTSAAMALAAAMLGRRSLVLTIDPARRLAQALGIPPTGKEPVRIDPAALKSAGVVIGDNGELHAWMLDPKVVLEGVVDRFAPSKEAADRIRRTRLYQALSEVLAGLQEYTAAEALYDFVAQKRFDLIVLDTPPSRNALDFLDAPRRLARFLDERTLFFFTPAAEGANALAKAASRIVTTALSKTFGEAFTRELQDFLGAFGTLFGKMRLHAGGVRELLRSERAAFCVITSPDPLAVTEAHFFKRRIMELGLKTHAFILNRSYAFSESYEHPLSVVERLGTSASLELVKSLKRLVPLANREAHLIAQHRQLLVDLAKQEHSDTSVAIMALPYLDEACDDLAGLERLATELIAK